MKFFTSLPSTLLLLLGVHLASGQNQPVPPGPLPPPVHNLSLEVSPASAGSRVQDQAIAHAGGARGRRGYTASRTRTTRASEALQINVRNFGALPDHARVEWYFLAAPTQPVAGKPAAEQEYIFDHGSQDLALGGGGAQVIAAESAEVASSVKTASRASRRVGSGPLSTAGGLQETGANLSGWIVRVVADGKVVAAKGSRQSYEDLARNDIGFAQLTDNHAPASGKKAARPHRPKKEPPSSL